MLQIASVGAILDNLGHKAACMFQMASFGTILDHVGLWAAAKGHSKVSPELSSCHSE